MGTSINYDEVGIRMAIEELRRLNGVEVMGLKIYIDVDSISKFLTLNNMKDSHGLLITGVILYCGGVTILACVCMGLGVAYFMREE